MPNGGAELTAERSPRLSKASPFGAFRVVFPPRLVGEIVTLGTGVAPVPPPSAVAANLTTVKGALALLDHRSPAASKTSAHGAWIEPAPSSLRTSCGASVPHPSRVRGLPPFRRGRSANGSLVQTKRPTRAANPIETVQAAEGAGARVRTAAWSRAQLRFETRSDERATPERCDQRATKLSAGPPDSQRRRSFFAAC